MRSYEIIAALVIVFLGVILASNLLSIERPSLEITEKNATQNMSSMESCVLATSAKITNFGSLAKNVILRANVISQTGIVIATKEYEAVDLDKNQFAVVSGNIEVSKPCSAVTEVVFSIKSFN